MTEGTGWKEREEGTEREEEEEEEVSSDGTIGVRLRSNSWNTC